MKKKLLILTMMLSMAIPITSYAAIELRDISAAYYSGGEWKAVSTSNYYQKIPDGWYEEDGKRFYFKNNYAVSSLQLIDGKNYLFSSKGILIPENTEEHNQYYDLLNKMNQAKKTNDESWILDVSEFDEYERICLLNTYCKLYMPGTEDIGLSGFKIVDNQLMLDSSNPDIGLESEIVDFYNKFAGIENLNEEEKIKQIHDIIVRTFDYDYSLTNYSDSLKEAFKNNNKIVCGGYAGIFTQVCNYYGIESEVLYGYGNGVEHAWNRVKINGKWKYIDCCWDDTSSSYEWYLKTKKEFDYTHTQY